MKTGQKGQFTARGQSDRLRLGMQERSPPRFDESLIQTGPTMRLRASFLDWWPHALIALAWLLAGQFGRQPWKPDEGYSFGIVIDFLLDGSWIVPSIGGEPFLEKPPLFYWLAAVLAKTFSPWLPLYEGARIASLLCCLVTFLSTAYAGKLLLGRRAGMMSGLLLAGMPVVWINTRFLITDQLLLAGFALYLAGFAALKKTPRIAGMVLGSAFAVAFLSKGLFGPGVLLGATALAIFVLPQLRTRATLSALIVACCVAVPVCAVWPVELYLQSPALFDTWLIDNNFGRFFGHNHLGPAGRGSVLLTFTVSFLPGSALAAWGVWTSRAGMRESAIVVPLAVVASMITVLSVSAQWRTLYLLGAAPAVALLATLGVRRMSEPVAAILSRGAHVILWFLTASVIIAGVLFAIRGELALPGLMEIAAEFLLVMAIVIAVEVSLRNSPDSRMRLCLALGGGLTLVATTATALLLHSVDPEMGYEAVFKDLATVLAPMEPICGVRVGESERALLEFFAGIRLVQRKPSEVADCNFVLIQDRLPERIALSAPDLVEVWRGSRKNDLHERFTLLRRK